MEPILAGIETEYGLAVEGRGAEDQIEDSMTLVRSYPGECFDTWDYRFESPRQDLRGFRLDQLAVDPQDQKFDRQTSRTDSDLRSDRVLLNGARFYNDHGHPEYATPECWSIDELTMHDVAGQSLVLRAATAYARANGLDVLIYKNNTDYHGASYGTHENYLVPRALGFDKLFSAVAPMLVARQILCGAGKVGAESGTWCDFQVSQRADFFAEPANAETLFRRPVFNTRDEPHGDPRQCIRLHVIGGDANLMPQCTRRKVGLVKFALMLAISGESPTFALRDPVRAFKEVSREPRTARIELEGGSWTQAECIIDTYLGQAERLISSNYSSDDSLSNELLNLIQECRTLLDDFSSRPDQFRRQVDWAAKRHMLEGFMESEGVGWREPIIQSLDLEYHRVDKEKALYHTLAEINEIEASPYSEEDVEMRETAVFEHTRAFARSLAVKNFRNELRGVSWGNLKFDWQGKIFDVTLDQTRAYNSELESAENVGQFIEMLGVKP